MMFKKSDTIIMKLLHYFIVNENYNQVIIHGTDNEIWLESFDNKYRIIRLVSQHIHNEEQLKLDNFKARSISNKIKKKTLSIKMNILNIYTDLSDDLELEEEEDLVNINITKDSDMKKSTVLQEAFENIDAKYLFNEKGDELFMKITSEINEKNNENLIQAKEVFQKGKPLLTYLFLIINLVFFLLSIVKSPNYVIYFFGAQADFIRNFEFYRLFTSLFVHVDLLHFLFNMYALYIIGPQLEDFYGKVKYPIIYLVSGIIGTLLSIVLSEYFTIGASGSIFGLLGSLVYFGYFHRVYLGNVIRKQIIPLIVINLIIGAMSSGVDNAAHIGGLIGGVVVSMCLGVKYKTPKIDRINGAVITSILIIFLSYLLFR